MYENEVMGELDIQRVIFGVGFKPVTLTPRINVGGYVNSWLCECDSILVPINLTELPMCCTGDTPNEALQQYVKTLVEYATEKYITIVGNDKVRRHFVWRELNEVERARRNQPRECTLKHGFRQTSLQPVKSPFDAFK
jgi:hypothetical protein